MRLSSKREWTLMSYKYSNNHFFREILSGKVKHPAFPSIDV